LHEGNVSLAFAYTLLTPNYAGGEDNESAQTVRSVVANTLRATNVLKSLTHHHSLVNTVCEEAFRIVCPLAEHQAQGTNQLQLQQRL